MINYLNWICALNGLLIARVLWYLPGAMRSMNEHELINAEVKKIYAEVEREKVHRGITDADYMREMRADHEVVLEIYKLKREVQTCDIVEPS